MWVEHCDQRIIRKKEKTKEGFLIVTGTIAKTGILTYQTDQGDRQEIVSKEVLFNEEHINSIKGKPLTLGHPPDSLSPANYKKFVVGSTGTEIFLNLDEEAIEAEFIINDEEAIDAVERRKITELSMGYLAEVEEREDGKFYQTRRICNHNSLVEIARCKGAKLHLDKKDSIKSKITYVF